MRSKLTILCVSVISQSEMILHNDGRVLLLLMVLSSLSQAGLFLIEVGEDEGSARGGCGRGEQYGEKCYRLHLLAKSWPAAQQLCSKRAKERLN